MPQLVTIGIPCFNAERWLEIAIRSALEQSHRPSEIVVVDDGSTDGSREVAASFADSVRLIAQSNGGADKARNTILENARGEWIQYLDADDYLIPVKVATQLAEAGPRADAADLLYAPTFTEDWSRGDARNRGEIGIDHWRDTIEQWILWQLPQTSGGLWRRQALERLGGWDEQAPCCQEHELYLRAIMAGMQLELTPSPGAVYRVWSERTLCRSNPRLTIAERGKLIERMLAWLDTSGRSRREYTRAAGRAFFEMARTLANLDLDEGANYHAAYRRRGLISLRRSPAAPLAYRLVYRLAGFRNAERLAAARRSTQA